MLFRKILFVLIGYLIVRFIYRIWKVRSALKQQFQQMQEDAKGHTPEGETRIHPPEIKRSSNSGSGDDGDYVDFEEVD